MTQTAVSDEAAVQQTDPITFPSLRLGNNEAARALLRQWMEDGSGYDERVWPQVKQMIEENRLSDRKRFADAE